MGVFSLEKNLEYLVNRPSGAIMPLDGIRSIAVIYVLVYHAFHLTQNLFSGVPGGVELFESHLNNFPFWLNWVWHGDRGVDIFFVISGFLIGGLLFNEYKRDNRINLLAFYWRRVIRLMPLYVLLIVIFYMFGPERGRDYVWANFLYINNFLSAKNVFIDWSWSLAVEQQFYVALPIFLLLIFFKTEYKFLSLTALFMLSFVVRFIILQSDPSLIEVNNCNNMFNVLPGFTANLGEKLYSNFYSRYGALMVGVIASYCTVYKHEQMVVFFKRKIADLLFVIALIFIVIWVSLPVFKPSFQPSAFLFKAYLVFDRNLFSIATGYIMLAVIYPAGLRMCVAGFLSIKPFYITAQLSYGIYLFHPLVLYIAGSLVMAFFPSEYMAIGGAFVLSVLTLFICSVLCSLTYLFIERPFMNMR